MRSTSPAHSHEATGECTHPAIAARTTTIHSAQGPRAFDCVKIKIVRSGSALLFGEFDQRHIKLGDVLLIAPCILLGTEPEGWVTLTTLYLDRDFAADYVFWQYVDLFTDWFHARQFVDNFESDPLRSLRLDEGRAGLLMPWLDELVALSLDGPPPERFYRMLSLLFAVLDVLAPQLGVAAPPQGPNAGFLPRGHRRFVPLRDHAMQAVKLLRASSHERWTLERLANEVHLSTSQLGRVFSESFGRSPISYLTMIRAERMAQLLRSTDEPIAIVARRVGWNDPDYAARLFRRTVGVPPSQYRHRSRQSSPES